MSVVFHHISLCVHTFLPTHCFVLQEILVSKLDYLHPVLTHLFGCRPV